MRKFESVDDLAKAVSQVAGLALDLSKGHSLHAAASAHHEGQAAYHKAAHEAMDDSHENKAHVAQQHAHHVFKDAHHKAMAESCKALEATATKLASAFGDDPELKKTDATIPVAGEGSDMAAILKAAFNENIASIKDSPEFKEVVKNLALTEVKKMFGNTVVPDNVRVAGNVNDPPADVLTHLKLIPRGSAGSGLQKAEVSADMEDAFAV